MIKGPNVFHPTVPSAVGSRNSVAQDGRIQKREFEQTINEETDAILQKIMTRLPREVLEQLDVMGGLKEKLYNYFNQNYQNMFNRYITTTEDEMVKKIRNFVDREETRILAKYTPTEIAELLDQIGGADKFNTGEVEKSVVNMYGHLQGHIHRGIYDLETETNALLRQKSDVGAFIRGENAYAVIKCAFKDNIFKPRTITDVKLSVNVLNSELISPIFHYQATVEYLIKDQISRTVIEMIDTEVERYQEELVDEGKEELKENEVLFEKIKRVPSYTDDEKEDESSARYRLVAKNLMEKIEGLRAEIDPEDFDAQNIRENIKKLVDIENIRNRGFNTAVNSITAILDTSKMGYQYIENLKNARELVLREYEEVDDAVLPDERFQLRLKYYDGAQLVKEQEAYDRQMEAFKNEITRLYDTAIAIYESGKSSFRIEDYDDLARKMSNRVRRKREEKGEPLYEEIEKVWNEIVKLKVEETSIEKLNRTYIYEKGLYKKMLIRVREIVQTIYGYRTPKERVVLEDRARFLGREFERFDYEINPYHVQPGIILDVDVTSIKRKRFMLNRMANVLNEFLHGISKGFQDAAFATFQRRRSTVREDIDQAFVASVPEGSAKFTSDAGDTASYTSSDASNTGSAGAGGDVKGSADVTPSGGDGLQEL